MKALFLCESKEMFDCVYANETKKAILSAYTGTEDILKKEDLHPNMDADVLFTTWTFPAFYTEEIKTYFPNLKAIFYGAGSVQKFARPFLEHGVAISSAWNANAVPVIEYATAQILLANKGFFRLCGAHSIEARTVAKNRVETYPGNFHTKVGLIGVGAIGSGVAKQLQAYDLDVYVYDPFLPDERAQSLGVTKAELSFLFANCQTISNHMANNPQTEGMLNYALFSKMKPNATFINTGRGQQVVEPDLIRALTEQPERTAVLDVTYPEPPEADSPLYRLPNVILTPHIAGSTGQERFRLGETACAEGLRFLNGEPLAGAVSLSMLATMA